MPGPVRHLLPLPLLASLSALAVATGMPVPERSAGLLQPREAEQVQGSVAITVRPTLQPRDVVYYLPEVRLFNEEGDPVARLELPADPSRAGTWTGRWETQGLPDGRYTLRLRVPYAREGRQKEELREEIEVGVRNSPRPVVTVRLGRLSGSLRAGGEGVTLLATALDDRRQPAAGVRLAWRTSLGELEEAATVTDGDGHAANTLTSEAPGRAHLTVIATGGASAAGGLTFSE